MNNVSPKSATVVLSRQLSPGQDMDYRNWHQGIVEIAQSHGGLIEVNLYEPIDGVQDDWIHVFVFDAVKNLRAFLDDAAFKQSVDDSADHFGEPLSQQVIASAKPSAVPVTVVISQLVKPEFAEDYQKWQLEIDAVARKYPGFLGTEMVKPVPGVQDEWVVVFRFDSGQHLDDWFASEDHDRLLKKAEPFFDRVQVRRVGRGFEDWFANAAGEQDGGPPQWKMAMIVLLTLYPTVMLITLFLGPLLAGWSLPYAMFVSNIVSVVVLTWPIMPAATRLFSFWLSGEDEKGLQKTLLGLGILLALYAVMIGIFSFAVG